MRDLSGTCTAKTTGVKKRGTPLTTTVSSHMVNYPLALQAARIERVRQSLLSACPACRARSAA